MKLKFKALLFYAAFFGGFMLLPKLAAVAGIISGRGEEFAVGFGWFFVVVVSQFFILRCPHCKKPAVITPQGWRTPWVGTRCRYCGEPY